MGKWEKCVSENKKHCTKTILPPQLHKMKWTVLSYQLGDLYRTFIDLLTRVGLFHKRDGSQFGL